MARYRPLCERHFYSWEENGLQGFGGFSAQAHQFQVCAALLLALQETTSWAKKSGNMLEVKGSLGSTYAMLKWCAHIHFSSSEDYMFCAQCCSYTKVSSLICCFLHFLQLIRQCSNFVVVSITSVKYERYQSLHMPKKDLADGLHYKHFIIFFALSVYGRHSILHPMVANHSSIYFCYTAVVVISHNA